MRKNGVGVKGAACSLGPHPAESSKKETRKQGDKETSDVKRGAKEEDFDCCSR